MKNIGMKWKKNLLKIEDEHIASKALIAALYGFEKTITGAKSNGTIAICVCAENELHEIGILCVKITLEHLGWKVVYPGSDLPLKSLSDLIKIVKPDLVCLSAKGSHLNKKGIEISELAIKNGIKIINGGNPDLKSANGIIYCQSLRQLIFELKKNFK
jgi:methanogenic corrinoid protein MtbC1